MRKIIGVLGGTFDPVHFGHLIAADSAREALGLTQLRFTLAGQPPHRPIGPASSSEDRLAMLRLATHDLEWAIVDDRETRTDASPYTIDTLAGIAAENPGADIVLIIGYDWVERFQSWHKAKEIIDNYRVAVVCRPSEAAENSEPRHEEPAFSYLESLSIGISSTEIRTRIKAGRSIRFLVPPAVEDYIYENGLYR